MPASMLSIHDVVSNLRFSRESKFINARAIVSIFLHSRRNEQNREDAFAIVVCDWQRTYIIFFNT